VKYFFITLVFLTLFSSSFLLVCYTPVHLHFVVLTTGN
jgi:hypothetical protein